MLDISTVLILAPVSAPDSMAQPCADGKEPLIEAKQPLEQVVLADLEDFAESVTIPEDDFG